MAHNGEINTLKGNKNWIKAHEPMINHPNFNGNIKNLIPIIPLNSSDSASLDSVMELLLRSGRNLPLVTKMLIPEAWSHRKDFSKKYKAFYAYCNSVIEPWDGPAAVCSFDGNWIVAAMDRNGLRPLRYTLTKDYLITGSETGMVPIKEEDILEKGRVGPGQMIGVNFSERKFYNDNKIKNLITKTQPYEDWVKNITHLSIKIINV